MGILLCGCCFTSLSAKTNEIILIISNIFCFFLIAMCFYLIKWNEISIINLILFIVILLIVVICFIFTILLRCWRSSGAIKKTKKSKGTTIVTAAFILTIINLIICVIEEVAFAISFSKKISCPDDYDNDEFPVYYRRASSKDCSQDIINVNRQYYISYLTLSYMEFMLILSICILSILKRRIINKTDNDIPSVIEGMGQYGRQVIVVHPEQMGGMGYQNNYNYCQNMNFGHRGNYGYYNQNINPQQVNVIPHNVQINGKNQLSKDKSYNSSFRSFE